MGCVVVLLVVGTAKKGERVPSGCVGCVTYVPGNWLGLLDRERGASGGGDDEIIGSRRYIVVVLWQRTWVYLYMVACSMYLEDGSQREAQ